MHILFNILSIVILTGTSFAQAATIDVQKTDIHTRNITLSVPVPSGDLIYKEYISFSVDHPDVTLSEWRSTNDPISFYDSAFKETKQAFNKNFELTLQAQIEEHTNIEQVNLHFSYYAKSQKKVVEEVIPLVLSHNQQSQTPTSINQQLAVNTQKVVQTTPIEKPQPTSQSWSDYISTLVQTTESLWVQLLLVLLLGLLMSLTPCIYPMIPITIGILQSQGSKSVGYNFLLALAYSFGIATTFALLGLAAAFSGQIFGAILAKPAFVIVVVLVLAYLALSMFGLYDMYIPRFMQQNSTSSKKGSLFSAFAFGAASGSIASPCLSPGLVLLLSIVTALGSKFLGFLLLFTFGVGLSIPLLIIGTFSGSLNVLPQAGMWMVEIKKLFGFILFGMCFYFLNNILPWHTILGMMSAFTLLSGGSYLQSAANTSSSAWRTAKNIFGIGLIASTVFLTAQSYKAFHISKSEPKDSVWQTEYHKALHIAQKENKKLLIDIGAPYCSMCKAIDASMFQDETVINTLKNCVAVKIDGSDSNNSDLIKQYNVIGFPTILLVDAHNESILKQWGSQLYDTPCADFIKELTAAF